MSNDDTQKDEIERIKKIVLQAMQFHWNDFVGDTNELPDDIELSNKRTRASYKNGRWSDLVAEDVALQIVESTSEVSE